MSVEFGIEVPGEANPLTEGILYHVLRSASSSDMQQVQTGTKQLQQWEKARGYYPLLQTVFLDKSLPLEVRYVPTGSGTGTRRHRRSTRGVAHSAA